MLTENTEKYISFSVPIKKEIIDGDGDIKIITYNIKFIDSFTEPQNGSQKWKYKKCDFFYFELKVMVCFNLKTLKMIFGKHLGYIIMSYLGEIAG